MAGTADRIMNLASFTGNFIGTKAMEGLESMVGTLVSLDPEGATETQLKMMRNELEKIATKLSEMEQKAAKERQEAEDAKAMYLKAKKAAEILVGKIDSDPSMEAKLGSKVDKLIDDAQAKKADWEREEKEAVSAERLSDMLQSVLEQKHQQMKKAETALKDAQYRMEMSKLEEQQARMEEDIAKMAEGTSSLGIALEKMDEKAKDAQARTAAREKLNNLDKDTDIMQDEDVLAALAEAEGTTSKPSRRDRLANL